MTKNDGNPQLNAQFIHTLVKNIENLSGALERIQERENNSRVETIDRINMVQDELKDLINKKAAESIICTSSVKTDTATMKSDINTLKTDIATMKLEFKKVNTETLLTSTKLKIYVAFGSLIGGGVASAILLFIVKLATKQISATP